MLMAAAELGVLFPGEEGARGAPPTPIPDGFTLWTGQATSGVAWPLQGAEC